MDRQVGTTIFERRFQLLDEQALAADRRQAAIQDSIALGRHRHELHGKAGVRATQQLGNVLGLPERELTLAGRDPKRRLWGRAHGETVLASGNSADFNR